LGDQKPPLMESCDSTPLISNFRPCRALDSVAVSQACGFAISPDAGQLFLDYNAIQEAVKELYEGVTPDDPNDVMIRSFGVSRLLKKSLLPPELSEQLCVHLERFAADHCRDLLLRPEGKSPLNAVTRVHTQQALEEAIQKAYAEHFTNGVIQRSEEPTFDPFQTVPTLIAQEATAISRTGLAISYEPKSQARDFVVVYATWGLAEDISRRTVARDEYWFHKLNLQNRSGSALYRRCGDKEFQLLYDPASQRLEHLPLSKEKGRRLSLSEEQARTLADCARLAEESLGRPVEIAWSASDDELFILDVKEMVAPAPPAIKFYRQSGQGPTLLKGRSVSHSVASGNVRVIRSREELDDFRDGEILVADQTEPDWEPGFRRAGAIVTEKDRRVSHSTILAREMGIPALLEAKECVQLLKDGQRVTVSCCHGDVGLVLSGDVAHQVEEFSLQRMPRQKTQLMVNLSMPERALSTAQFPWAGAGLIRSEFMIGGWVKIHPLALLHTERLDPDAQSAVRRLCHGFQDGRDYYLKKMTQAIGLFAGAFWPRPVTLRLSDFKSNEYARLLGGAHFEPKEQNSMLGWRGASRYLHPDYSEAFGLELEAIKEVRANLGFTNLKVMIPFCRTPEEGEEILRVMESAGLKKGDCGLEVWSMAELPSNVLMAQEFAEIFDGMSIGSSDLTALTLGVARNAEKISDYFDEMHPAMMRAYETIIEAAHGAGKPVSFCGQVASEDPEFAALLVEMGIDILSLAPDALHRTLQRLETC
jgi:pyruvate, water dikinase